MTKYAEAKSGLAFLVQKGSVLVPAAVAVPVCAARTGWWCGMMRSVHGSARARSAERAPWPWLMRYVDWYGQCRGRSAVRPLPCR
jgi:hypothetical protein